MPFWGIVAPGFKRITTQYSDLDKYRKLIPYAMIRKFAERDDAYEFITSFTSKRRYGEMYKYGTGGGSKSMKLTYIIESGIVYISLCTRELGRVISVFENEEVSVQNRTNSILAVWRNSSLDPYSIKTHLRVILLALDVAGSYANVEVCVDTLSIYYALTCYSGNDSFILHCQEFIRDRLGYTVYTHRGGVNNFIDKYNTCEDEEQWSSKSN